MMHMQTAHSDAAFSGDIAVRRPAAADIPGLALVFSEMQCHYARPVSVASATAAAALACKPPVNTFDPHILVAVTAQELIGSLVMNVTFPASELTRSLYIRDLYVKRTMRRHGVGQALVRAAARLALSEGFSGARMDDGHRKHRGTYDVRGMRREADGPDLLSPVRRRADIRRALSDQSGAA
jgi:GNAT superfamily N-acetyltransferase